MNNRRIPEPERFFFDSSSALDLVFGRALVLSLLCVSVLMSLCSLSIVSLSHSSDNYTYLQVSEVLDAHRYKSAMIVLRSCGMTVHVILIVQERESVVWMDVGIHVLNLVSSDN